MNLKDWLKTTGSKQSDLAEKLVVSQGRVSQIARNGTHSLGMALKIEQATEGAVTAAELLAEPKGDEGEAA